MELGFWGPTQRLLPGGSQWVYTDTSVLTLHSLVALWVVDSFKDYRYNAANICAPLFW